MDIVTRPDADQHVVAAPSPIKINQTPGVYTYMHVYLSTHLLSPVSYLKISGPHLSCTL